MLPHPHLNSYQQKAINTRSRRQVAGRYASTAHIAAFKRMLAVGASSLTQAELTALATHPHLLQRQRDHYAALAAQSELDGDGCVCNMPTVNAA